MFNTKRINPIREQRTLFYLIPTNHPPTTSPSSPSIPSASHSNMDASGWTKHYDERYGSYYYSHPVHGSRWDDPALSEGAAASSSSSSHSTGAVGASGDASAGPSAAPPSYSPSQATSSHPADDISQLKKALARKEADIEMVALASPLTADLSKNAALVAGQGTDTDAHKQQATNLDAKSKGDFQAGFAASSVGTAGYYSAQQQQHTYQQQSTTSYNSYNSYNSSQAAYPLAAIPQSSYKTSPAQQSASQVQQTSPNPSMAGLYAPISAYPPAPESTFSSVSHQTTPLNDDDAYFAGLPAGAKRVSYASSSANASPAAATSPGPSRLSQTPFAAASAAPPSGTPSKSASSPSISSANQNDEDEYYSRLPIGAKRISYNTHGSSEDTKALLSPSGGKYGTNQDPKKPYPVSPQSASQPLSRRERRRMEETDRRYCCCFRTRGGCCFFSLSLTFLILAGLGIFGFFFWPRIPTIDISEPYVAPNVAPLTVSGSLLTATNSTPFVLQLRMAVNVSVYSPNRISYFVNNIIFAGALVDLDGVSVIPNANVNGNVANVAFPPFKQSNFTMPLELMYSVTSAQTVLTGGDKALNVFQARCGGGANGKLNLKYTVSVNLAILAWTGYKPSFSGSTSFPCSAIGWNNVLSALTKT
ncbi:hypothetical protein HDU78_006831 [Chytriomyces hyalinus]|nr:hypothetical protein HDU78_006831 [Chytriomyces hyalinus]